MININMDFIKKIIVIVKYIFIFIFIIFSFQVNSKDMQLKIIGNKNLDEEFIKSILNLNNEFKGDELTNYIIKELFSTGYFNSVNAQIANDILIINLIENPVINKIKFVNNERFKDDDLNLIIKGKLIDTDVYNKSVAEKINNLLIQFYKNYG